jgi:hypothetical protein
MVEAGCDEERNGAGVGVRDFVRETLREHRKLRFEDLWYLARKGSIGVTEGSLRVICSRMKKSGELVNEGKPGAPGEWRLRRQYSPDRDGVPVPRKIPEREAP